MAIEELLEQMDAALDDGDIATARELLGEVRVEFRRGTRGTGCALISREMRYL